MRRACTTFTLQYAFFGFKKKGESSSLSTRSTNNNFNTMAIEWDPKTESPVSLFLTLKLVPLRIVPLILLICSGNDCSCCRVTRLSSEREFVTIIRSIHRSNPVRPLRYYRNGFLLRRHLFHQQGTRKNSQTSSP